MGICEVYAARTVYGKSTLAGPIQGPWLPPVNHSKPLSGATRAQANPGCSWTVSSEIKQEFGDKAAREPT